MSRPTLCGEEFFPHKLSFRGRRGFEFHFERFDPRQISQHKK
jgi:hypothetical protein